MPSPGKRRKRQSGIDRAGSRPRGGDHDDPVRGSNGRLIRTARESWEQDRALLRAHGKSDKPFDEAPRPRPWEAIAEGLELAARQAEAADVTAEAPWARIAEALDRIAATLDAAAEAAAEEGAK